MIMEMVDRSVMLVLLKPQELLQRQARFSTLRRTVDRKKFFAGSLSLLNL